MHHPGADRVNPAPRLLRRPSQLPSIKKGGLPERGVSANELHRIFECGNNQPRRWARIGAPRYVALALAAVVRDIPPWTPRANPRKSFL